MQEKSKSIFPTELQQDYNYFMAQKTAALMLSAELISLVEFNK